MLRSQRRKTALTTTALMATVLFLTACEDEGAATSGTSDSSVASESTAKGGSDDKHGADSAGADSGVKVTGKVRREHEGVAVRGVREQACTTGTSAVLVLFEAAVDVRLVHLDRAVQEVAGEERPVAPGAQGG